MNSTRRESLKVFAAFGAIAPGGAGMRAWAAPVKAGVRRIQSTDLG